ncbi:hypothetical protein COLO4_08015 [Corchorus olitorius]|uniref:Uncharacterized protein n=1 Tax=Corchorus olitorius TaxID=93759 RepID=A0A1R3KHW0_9ROSI|nr:hypothetical protein COLO4_08015 [Corchorus olitorius]
MMATMIDVSNPYDGGLGDGGKFRKWPSTPYDRPPTAIRNPSGGAGKNGWLSKLVDLAQRLITSSAHRLFASVFRKRLPAPPPHPPQALEPGEDSLPIRSKKHRSDSLGSSSQNSDLSDTQELDLELRLSLQISNFMPLKCCMMKLSTAIWNAILFIGIGVLSSADASRGGRSPPPQPKKHLQL